MARILVVDDDADLRLLLKFDLERVGHRVSFAEDGLIALDRVDEDRPDLILLDGQMPHLDGFSVLRELKARCPEIASIPVVMLTVQDGLVDVATGGIEGAVRYITKPFELVVLHDALEKALAGDEAALRRRAAREALELLAQAEAGGEGRAPLGGGPHRPRLRLSGLERERPVPSSRPQPVVHPAAELVALLTEKQRALLDELARTTTVSDAAAQLGMSRSNLYASLRRVNRKLGTRSVPELLAVVRSGQLH